jgi:hypothetical protein
VSAAVEVEQLLGTSPRRHALRHTRWRLADLGQVIPWLAGKSVPGIRRVLQVLHFGRKQAQKFVRSPDPLFDCKWRAILAAYAQAVAQPERVVLVWLDEVSFYRQPSVAPAYHRRGAGQQPYARQQPGANTQTRVLGGLNALSGQVIYHTWSQVTLPHFCAFASQLRAAYPQAQRIYVVLDNWPTHTSPHALAAFAQQRLTPLFLPTYASWLNPIEKLWRWLRQEVIHLHEHANDLAALRQEVRDFLDRFAQGSTDLLRYVGLLAD